MQQRDTVIDQKISIGISGCCYGSKVRYNNKGWDFLDFIGREKGDYIWHPVCPECMAGFGVPRNPIRIAGGTGNEVWSGEAKVMQQGKGDVTDYLKEGARTCMDTLIRGGVEVFVYMDGSPSCGVYRTNLKKQKRGNPPGVFGSLLLKEGYFLIPALELQSPIKWWDWRRRMLAFIWLKEQRIETKDDIYSVWHILKFLCQEIDNEKAREIGRIIASADDNSLDETILTLRSEIAETLRKPSTVARIKQSLWKNYSHYRKITGNEIEMIKEPTDLRNMTTIAAELVKMERESFEKGFSFGTSPIIYRDKSRR
jgi:uncharacterized protein YbbK (DUF523 family)